MYSSTKTIEINGLTSSIIDIEANIFNGMFAFSIVGLKQSKSKETKEKIISCLKNLNMRLPNKRIVVNFSKNKAFVNEDYYDLPILISLLKSLKVVKEVGEMVFAGQINLNGDLIPLVNPYRIIKEAMDKGVKNLIIPYDENIFNFEKDGMKIYYAKNIYEVLDFLNHGISVSHIKSYNFNSDSSNITSISINDIVGQKALIRALIISLVGRHHILVSGVSGAGKSISIEAIKSILPECSNPEKLYINAFNQDSSNQFLYKPLILKSLPNIKLKDFIGNAKHLGLIVKSAKSFLYMDEINTYSKAIIDNLRIPMENREIDYQDNEETIYANCDFTLIASMNPCPCGNLGSDINKCTCTLAQIGRYQDKVNKPLEDRFHLKIRVEPVNLQKDTKSKYDLEDISKNIKRAWNLQKNRYNNVVGMYNGRLTKNEVDEYIKIDSSLLVLIDDLIHFYNLSMRIRSNIISVARSIADYENSKEIQEKHIYEAFNYQKF